MSIVGTARVLCPGCGREHDAQLVQSINTRKDPEVKQRLLLGELNVLACDCGRRSQLAANVLFHDPDADYYCQVVPGGEAAIARAAEVFRAAAGPTGTQRIVPSMNALVEKVKLLDAGLEDWAIEMTKVLLLASVPESDLDRVLLFERLDRDEGVLRWLMFDREEAPTLLSSPLSSYDKLAASTHVRPAPGELRIDRAWAVDAVRTMIASAN
jgi:hypothetical protein